MTQQHAMHTAGYTEPVSGADDVSRQAQREFTEAAERAGVSLRLLHGIEQMRAAGSIFDTVWGTRDGRQQLDASLMVAFEEAGGYVVGAFDLSDELVGAGVGFARYPTGLHSHIVGVLPPQAHLGIGTAIKLHQRVWCIERGIASVTWTFDPLVARNAHFNLARLGAQAERYLIDVYGTMHDGLNRGTPSDRLFMRWDVRRPQRRDIDGTAAWPWLESHDGLPVVVPTGDTAASRLVQVPRDIESLRRLDPPLALAWRLAVREVLVTALRSGWEIEGFDPDAKYVLRPAP